MALERCFNAIRFLLFGVKKSPYQSCVSHIKSLPL